MSTPDVTAPVTAPIGWAKARPVAFAIFLLIVVILTIRFRERIASVLSKIPVVGKWLTGIAGAAVFLVCSHMGPPRTRVIESYGAPVAAACHVVGYSHGHRTTALAHLDGRGLGGFLVEPPALTGRGVTS